MSLVLQSRPSLEQSFFNRAYSFIPEEQKYSALNLASSKIKMVAHLVACAFVETFSPSSVKCNLANLADKFRKHKRFLPQESYKYSAKILQLLHVKPLMGSQKKALENIEHLRALNPHLSEAYRDQALYLFTHPAFYLGKKRPLQKCSSGAFFHIELDALKKLPDYEMAINYFIYQMNHDVLSFDTYEELLKKTRGFRATETRQLALLNLLVAKAKEGFTLDVSRFKMQFRIGLEVIAGFREMQLKSPKLSEKEYTALIFDKAFAYFHRSDFSDYEATKMAALLLYSCSQASQAEFVTYSREILSKYTPNACSCSAMTQKGPLYHKHVQVDKKGFRILSKQIYDFINFDQRLGALHTPFEVLLEVCGDLSQTQANYLVVDLDLKTLKGLLRQDVVDNLMVYFQALRQKVHLSVLNPSYVDKFIEHFSQKRFFHELEKSFDMQIIKPFSHFFTLKIPSSTVLLADKELAKDPANPSHVILTEKQYRAISSQKTKRHVGNIHAYLHSQLLSRVKQKSLEVYVNGESCFNHHKTAQIKDIEKLHKKMVRFFEEAGLKYAKANFEALCLLHSFDNLESLIYQGARHKVALFNDRLNLSNYEDKSLGFFELCHGNSHQDSSTQLYLYQQEGEICFGIKIKDFMQLFFVPHMDAVQQYPVLQKLSQSLYHKIPISLYLESQNDHVKIVYKKYQWPPEEMPSIE